MNCLSPSILAADFTRLGEQVRALDEAGAQYLHIDVMDGMFVPDISFGMPIIQSIRQQTSRIFDLHLMIEEPVRFIKEFADCGADIITVHAEACKHLDWTIQKIHEHKVMAGVAINPATPISAVEHILSTVDMVLIMTVNPGFGGQKLIPYTIDKVRDLKSYIDEHGLTTDIEVDGGVNFDNVRELLRAGANVIVSGNAVFKGDIGKNTEAFLRILSEEQIKG